MKNINLLPLIAIAVLFSISSVLAQTEPEIMSYKDYGKIRHERPYVLEFKTEKGALVYFGAGHFYRYDDAQAAEIEKRLASFKPTVILNESGTPPVAETAKEAVEKYGEPGLLAFLAKKHNIPIKSLDPPRIEEMKYILGTKRWTLEQVFLFYVLRRVPENNRKTNPKKPEELVEEAMSGAAKMPGFESLPKTIAEFDQVAKKNLPTVANWRTIDQKIFDPNPDLGNFTNDIADASVNYRGRFMVKSLAAEVEKGERVFAVVGASHVVKQEKALKSLFNRN
jgi:hypothetical protein